MLVSSERGEQGQLGNQRYTLVFIPTSFRTHHSIPRPRAAYGLGGMRQSKESTRQDPAPGKTSKAVDTERTFRGYNRQTLHGSLHRTAGLVVKCQGTQGLWEAFGESERAPKRRARWPDGGGGVG